MNHGKTRLFAWIVAIGCILGACALAQEDDGSMSTYPSVEWLTHTLCVYSVNDSPSYIFGSPALEGERFLLMQLISGGDVIPIMDIIQNVSMFSLKDQDGNEYVAVAYFPQSMVFYTDRSVFSTAPEQIAFELLFIVPEGVSAETLTLSVESSPGGSRNEVSLSEVPVSSLFITGAGWESVAREGK